MQINLGNPFNGVKKRGSFDFGCRCSFTSQFGQIIPSYKKEIIDGSHITFTPRSLVRMNSLAVATFGKMSLKHFTYFVPMTKIFEPFDALRSKRPYRYAVGSNPQIPLSVPQIDMAHMGALLLFNIVNRNGYGALFDDYYHTVSQSERNSNVNEYLGLRIASIDASGSYNTSSVTRGLLSSFLSLNSDARACIPIVVKEDPQDLDVPFAIYDVTDGNYVLYQNFRTSLIETYTNFDDSFRLTVENSDLVISVNNGNRVLISFGPILKRFLVVTQGLGYGYAFSGALQSILPLMAYYYAWYETFGIQTLSNFESTACSRLLQFFNRNNLSSTGWRNSFMIKNNNNLLGDLLYDIVFNIGYNYSSDYFTSHISSVDNGLPSNDFTINSFNDVEGNVSSLHSLNSGDIHSEHPYDDINNIGIVNKLASQALRFININTVIGQSIAKWCAAHGVTPPEYRDRCLIGAQSLDIDVMDVVSTSDNLDTGLELGETGARAIGSSQNPRTYQYDTKDFGYLLNLSVVVPEIGYYQGIDSENLHTDWNSIYLDEFDSLGYTPTIRLEVNSDYADFNQPSVGIIKTYDDVIGLKPRFLEYKVKQNSIIGNFRFKSVANSMSGFTLEKNFGYDPKNLPDLQSEAFRSVNSINDRFNLNRIFLVTDSLEDKFFVNNVFSVKVSCNMIPIMDSYLNTEQSGENITELS